MRKHHLFAIFKLYTNSFCRKWVGLEALIKVTSKADRLRAEKVLQKLDFLLNFFQQ